MKYRKKPIVVEATQWFPDGDEVAGVYTDEVCNFKDRDNPTKEHYVITIHNQRAYLDPGDYVITEPDNIHHYPCKPQIFEATYESV